jgi:hypothetical protein
VTRLPRNVAFAVLLFIACQKLPACPSPAGGSCDPTDPNCPKGYSCAAAAQVCTRACEQDSDCWVKVEDGCRANSLPGERFPDGGVFVESSEDGFCSETKLMVCLAGYCQRSSCVQDPGCDDLYGPSPYAGNRSQGPQ